MWLVLFLIIQDVQTISYYCETDSHCTSLLPNSKCLNRKCVELRSRRDLTPGMRMLGEECDWTIQCQRTSMDSTKACLTRKCQCSSGYIPIDAYRCIHDFVMPLPNKRVGNLVESEPLGFGSACSIDRDCQRMTTYLECIHGTCICKAGHVPLGKYLCFNLNSHGLPVIDTTPIVAIPLSSTSPDYPVKNEVIKSLGKLGNSCTNDYFCRRTVPQSHCYNGHCTCLEDFISMDQYTCMKRMDEETTTRTTPIPVDYKSLLGGKCSIKRNCHTYNAICLNSICTCPQGYFPVDDWTCLEAPESSDEESIETTTIITTTTSAMPTTTTIFRWWPWSPTPTTSLPLQNAFRVRCLLNRQCASMDKNSHCTLFGRCICNRGFQLQTTMRGQHCISQTTNEHDCD
ncbi:unnamed protein product [Adineta ricciae]|uniref:EB domain-containing protein n=2 Tax=Adineta ricciae TaxID=249248 RepID=A0A816C4D6_ADIRI|nr:unnamed protein product [Adineta ricciae]